MMLQQKKYQEHLVLQVLVQPILQTKDKLQMVLLIM